MDVDLRDLDPEAVLKQLAGRNEPDSPTSRDSITRMCLEANGGYFLLAYQGEIPDTKSYDWIGLYKSVEADDSEWIGGNNWNWACRGRTYWTSTLVNTSGYEARYLVYKGGRYVSVRRSGPLGMACG